MFDNKRQPATLIQEQLIRPFNYHPLADLCTFRCHKITNSLFAVY